MRRGRALAENTEGYYRCASAVVGGMELLTPEDRTYFCQLLERLARFCQVSTGTLCCLADGFELLVRVPAKVELTDQELFEALQSRYGPEHRNIRQFLRALNCPDKTLLHTLRERYLARMGNVAVFLKELKENFTRWFNDKYERFGTLWAHRFTSTSYDPDRTLLAIVAADIELSSVRVAAAPHPAAYEHCGFAQALRNDGPARSALAEFLPGQDWPEKLSYYQSLLDAATEGSDPQSNNPAHLYETYLKTGKLSFAKSLLLGLCALTEAIALGPVQFIDANFAKYYAAGCKRPRPSHFPVEGVAELAGMATLKKLRHIFRIPR